MFGLSPSDLSSEFSHLIHLDLRACIIAGVTFSLPSFNILFLFGLLSRRSLVDFALSDFFGWILRLSKSSILCLTIAQRVKLALFAQSMGF
jgi:hypothetical protein